MHPHIIFFRNLEFVAYTPLDIVATLSQIGSVFGYHSHVDIEEAFDRRVES